MTSARRSRRRSTHRPSASAPCTWNTFLAMSRPITAGLGMSPPSDCHRDPGRSQDRRPGGGPCHHVNTIEGFWSLLRSWLRPHRGISQDKLPLYLGFFQFVHNARRRGKALLGALVAALVACPNLITPKPDKSD